MKDFRNLNRNTLLQELPLGSWKHAKNILKTKGFKSITNEHGFDFSLYVKGTIIGKIETAKDIVVFHKNFEGVDEIGVINLNNDIPTYRTIIKTNLLSFQYNCAIEGVFVYNYKKELLIAWCDGVYNNSNPPRALNTTTLPFAINPDGTLVNPDTFSLLNLTPNKKQGNLQITYNSVGLFGGYTMYLTFTYVFEDNSNAGYFESSDTAKLGYGVNPIESVGLLLNFTNLDTNFNKLRIGVVIKTEPDENSEGVLTGFEGEILQYTGDSLEVQLTSLENFTETSAEAIIIQNTIFTKVNTMTKQNKEVDIGNVETVNSGTAIKFQKYANLINLQPFEYRDEYDENAEYFQDACFLPDEVYAFYIQLQLLDGSYTDAFHIPGREALGTERDNITAQQITDFNLTWTGDFNGIKQFHVFNNGFVKGVNAHTVGTDYHPTLADDETANVFGYWENVETYPNADEYNSVLDYEGDALGGQDLRGTPVRYCRFPSVYSMVEESRNTSGVLTRSNDQGIFPWLPEKNNYAYPYRKLGVKITNIENVIPAEIQNKIQGYRLLHVKRNSNNSYVLGNWMALRRKDVDDGRTLVNSDGFFEHYDFGFYTEDANKTDFSNVRVVGNELFKFRPTLSPTYIAVNKVCSVLDGTQLAGFTYAPNLAIPNEYRFSKCNSSLRYRQGDNAAINTEYHEEGINLDLSNDFYAFTNPDNVFGDEDLGVQRYGLNITAFNQVLNVYSGFNSDKLNVIGRTGTITNNTRFKKGDVYVTSKQEINLRSRVYAYNGSGGFVLVRKQLNLLVGGLFSPLNYSLLKNEPLIDPSTTDEAVLAEGDYDFDIIENPSMHPILDIAVNFTFDVNSDFVDKFPYRVYRGLKIANETLDLKALTTFPVDNYYEMPNDKGEIIALRGLDRTLYIQMRFALFVAVVKDKLNTREEETYLGTSDLFDRKPEEILADDKGFIGSVSKFSCSIFKGSYITQNVLTGQIFMIGQGVREISAMDNKNWFWNHWDNGLDYYYIGDDGEKRRIDNPYLSVGHLVGFDKEFNRLLFIKKMYRFKTPDLLGDTVGINTVNFDGEFYSINEVKIDFNNETYFENISRTLSFSLEGEGEWVCEHDYFPNIIFNTINKLYSFTNLLNGENRASLYKHNSKTVMGLFYGTKYSSYVDIVFNSRNEITKIYQSFTWRTLVESLQTTAIFKDETITGIMVYNNHQCSGIVNLKTNHFKLTREIEGDWSFKDFRDLVINENQPIIEENGELNVNNINSNKNWFEKSNFISKFIVVRLIIDNVSNKVVYINEINSKSILSNR